jgi:type IV secretion system protein VirB5
MAKRYRFYGLVIAASVTLSTHAAAQMAVVDINAITQLLKQLEQAKAHLSQMQQTHASFNKLTDMGQIASALNSSALRKALPGDFASVQAALQGQGGGSTETWLRQDQVYTPAGGAYVTEVQRAQNQNAGTKSIAQQMYDAASKRIDGIETLRQQIGRSEDPKTAMDLAARLGVEQAAAQQDIVRMQALAIVAQAQQRVDDERKAELFEQALDAEIARYTSN